MTKKYQGMYMLFDHEGNPVPSSLRYVKKNSIGTLEPKEWELRKSQGWTCEKISLVIEIVK